MIIELAISYADRNHDEAPFPFDCREGGQTLASHTDVYWKFGNFVERQPENLEEIAIESNLDFERDRFLWWSDVARLPQCWNY